MRTPKGPPSPLGRLIARHPWRTAALYVVLFALPQIARTAVAGGHHPGLFSVVIFITFAVPLGLVVGFSARNAVARWDKANAPGGDPG